MVLQFLAAFKTVLGVHAQHDIWEWLWWRPDRLRDNNRAFPLSQLPGI